jgi:hypothetical protein
LKHRCYKTEYLIAAFDKLLKKDRSYRLLIVGKPKGPESYWHWIGRAIASSGIADRVMENRIVSRMKTEASKRPTFDPTLYHVFQSGFPDIVLACRPSPPTLEA